MPGQMFKILLGKNKNIRGQNERLFCSVRKPQRPLSKNAASFFIKRSILDAHLTMSNQDLRVHKIKAHEVRAVSTSLAFKLNIGMAKILEAACWKTNSVFAAHYLRDISYEFGDLRSLGPFVSAKSVVV